MPKKLQPKETPSKIITAPVNKIINHSIVDGRGNRTAVFLQGCNFDCKYCHNPETINTNDKTVTIMHMTAAEVAEKVLENTPFIRGVTVSGGECTLYPEFLRQFFEIIKEVGRGKGPGGADLTCSIDSNGSYEFEKDPQLLSVMDGVLLDVKEVDPETHKIITKASNEIVLKNLKFLADKGKLEELRTVVIPGITNTEDTIIMIAKSLGKKVEEVPLRIIRYRPVGVRKEMQKELKIPAEEDLGKLKLLAEEEGFKKIIVT